MDVIAQSSGRPKTEPEKIRVFLADDHDVVRQGLRSVLQRSSNPPIEVSGEASTGTEAVRKINELKPDVAILDISMPELNGLEVTRKIRERCPHVKVLILTVHESEQLIEDVLSAGARGYLLKRDAARHLAIAVESLFHGVLFLSSKPAELVMQVFLNQVNSEGGSSILSTSEREILQLLAEGHSNKQIAAMKGITVKTAETHRVNIMRKLKVRSVSGLVHYSVRNGIIDA
ncbi:MAG: response regulator [Terriglobia bacterium]